MIIQAGDLAVEIDIGTNEPGAIQHLEDGRWSDYLVNGELLTWPVKLERLEPGRYRVLEKNPSHC